MKKTIIRCLLTIASAATLSTQAQEVTCYTVRDSKGKIIDQTTEAPVDMSKHLSQTLPQKYGPGSTMIVGPSDFTSCSEKIASASTETNGFIGYTASSFSADSGYGGSSSGSYSGSYSPSSYGSYGTSSAGRYAVSSYYRNDGTYVRAHTRGYSSGGGGGGGGGRRR